MKDDFTINNTTQKDLPNILWIFEQAINLQRKNGYKVWGSIDEIALEGEIARQLQYKIVRNGDILCLFSVQFSDPLIWLEKDKGDAIYLHRIVVNPQFKGQKLFEKVLNWAMNFATTHNLSYIRMDTWAENTQLIDYYKTFGFAFMGNTKTPDNVNLPIQNRNLNVALLELHV